MCMKEINRQQDRVSFSRYLLVGVDEQRMSEISLRYSFCSQVGTQRQLQALVKAVGTRVTNVAEALHLWIGLLKSHKKHLHSEAVVCFGRP